MPVLLFLNELSCTSATPRWLADQAMVELVELLRMIRQWRGDAALVTQVPLKSTELARGYYIQQWIAADPANRDRWLIIRAIQNRAPFRSVIPQDARDDVEYWHETHSAEGIGAAHLLEGLAVSLGVAAAWEHPWITADRSILAENDSGDPVILEERVEVRHAATCDHAACHKIWAQETGLDGLTSGAAIWKNKADLFPHITFLPRVEDDLRSLRQDWVRPAVGQLLKVEEAVSEWNASHAALPAWKTKVTGEFETRQREFSEFTDLDGVVRVFELHARITPGPGRLHFRLVPEDRTARVAFIGRKRD